MTDNAKAFKSKAMGAFCEKNGILLKHSTPYYPQGNGLAESSNKNIIQSIRKLLKHNKRSWDSMLKYALWADRITVKKKWNFSFPISIWYRCSFSCSVGYPSDEVFSRLSGGT